MNVVSTNPAAASLVISLIINMAFFAFAALLRTDKVTDLSYSLSFFIMAPILLFSAGRPIPGGSAIVASAIMIWALRLGTYLFRRILVMKNDERFDDKRDDFFAFLRFWILQTVVAWLVMLPYALVLTQPDAVYPAAMFVPGLLIFTSGLILETISDRQKFRFRSNPENRNRWMDRGLWSRSRHPNYFGEILLWWGLFITVLPNLRGWMLLAALGPVALSLLITFVSGVPILEKSAEKRYGDNPEFRKYRDSTPKMIPRLRAIR